MSLDREAARALFDNAEPMPATAGGAPFAAASPFAPASDDAFAPVGNEALAARMSGRSTRKGPDWRLIAPVGVAALCAGAVLLVATQRNDAQPGKDVAATTVIRTTPMPAPAAPPIESAAVTPPPSSIVEPPAVKPAAVVRTQVRTAPVTRRATAPRTVAAAPSASDASSNVSAREPYVPPPVLGAPAQVTVTPVAPPPVETVEPQPVTPPQP